MQTKLEGRSLHQRILALNEVYDKIEAAQSAFRLRAGDRGAALACPQGCSACCGGFIPDVLPVEADLIAFHLLVGRNDLLEPYLEKKNSPEGLGPTCAFWNPLGSGKNCSIYRARPLICRFFGFSAVRHKSGEPAFTICRWMPFPAGAEGRILVGKVSLEEIFGAVPPLMTDLSLEAVFLDPAGAGSRLSLREAIGPALANLSLWLRLASEASDAGLQKLPRDYSL